MAWGHSSVNQLYRIDSFGKAEHVFNTVNAIRGQDKYLVGVPLRDDRRDWKYKALVKLDDDTYAAKLYDTNVITWHRNGSVTLNMRYGSSTTDQFADFFLRNSGFPIWVRTPSHISVKFEHLTKAIRDRVAYENKDVPDFCGFSVNPHAREFVLTQHEDGISFDTCGAPHKEYVNKTKAFDVRKAYKPVLDYLRIFTAYPMAADDAEPMVKEFAQSTDSEFVRRYGLNQYGMARFKAKLLHAVALEPDNEEYWPILAAAYHTRRYDWQSSTQHFDFSEFDTLKKDLYAAAYKNAGSTSEKPLPFGYLTRGWVNRAA